MKDKGTCSCCNKSRVIFYNNMCQVCYRKSILREFKTKDGIEIKNSKHRKIVKMFIKNKVPREDIADYFDMTKRNIDIIISKYCEKKTM